MTGPTEAMYWSMAMPTRPQRAEAFKTTDWPIDCAVCWFEHHKSVPAKSRRAALLHRRKWHSWLADALAEVPA